jgi:hypothetical protein
LIKKLIMQMSNTAGSVATPLSAIVATLTLDPSVPADTQAKLVAAQNFEEGRGPAPDGYPTSGSCTDASAYYKSLADTIPDA